jgi:POT family proton-dependent oligopeptide transporter
MVLFLGAAMFWSGFEQAGSSMNLFAKDHTDLIMLGWEIPAGYFQQINPLFIVIFAPVFGMLWVRLGKYNPSIPVKFGMGLVLLAVGFLVLAWGSTFIEAGKVSPMWLIVTYFFHTIGELCLSPVGLSAITKLSPKRMVSQMMGTWFLGAALGNLIAGLIASYLEELDTATLFATVAAIACGTGFLFLIFSGLIKKLTGKVY